MRISRLQISSLTLVALAGASAWILAASSKSRRSILTPGIPTRVGRRSICSYASDGADPKFNAEPKGNTAPTTAGWKLLATVDTRPKQGQAGGQYGVSITNSTGALGKYRYLLFDCVATETDDDWGNTFYSEVDVVAKKKAPAL